MNIVKQNKIKLQISKASFPNVRLNLNYNFNYIEKSI